MGQDNLGLMLMGGCEEFGSQVEYYLKNWQNYEGSYTIKATCPRFSTGEGKGMLLETIRGRDIFIISDPFNYSVTYRMYGMEVPMSPDDHFQDIKRMLSAIGGKAKRITVIMPMLYEGRQHRKIHRESLDCAIALQELEDMGVTNIVTFDAHDPRVQNAIPMCGFDNLQPKYQMVKALVRAVEGIQFNKRKTVMITPDEGGVNRCLSYASVLNLEMGICYKRRDVSKVVNGKNPIVAHEYIGSDLGGRDAIIVDDMISSGGSLIDTFEALKENGAGRIFSFITFGLFCSGYADFDKAYERGLFDKIFFTNLTYNPKALLDKPWAVQVNMSKYTAYVIAAIHQDASVGAIIDPNSKILELLKRIS